MADDDLDRVWVNISKEAKCKPELQGKIGYIDEEKSFGAVIAPVFKCKDCGELPEVRRFLTLRPSYVFFCSHWSTGRLNKNREEALREWNMHQLSALKRLKIVAID